MFSDAVSYRRDFPPAELGLRQVCRADQAKSASAHQRSQSPRRRVTCVRRKRLELGASWRTSELLFHLCPIRHIDDAILERGLEESNVRFWFVHFARLLVFRHVEVEYVVKHEAKVGVWVDSRFNFHGGFVCQFEMRGELAAAEARLGEALALFGPALEHCQIFYRRIVASVPVVLWFASWQTGQCGKTHACFDDIFHVPQCQGVALRAVFFCEKRFRIADRKSGLHFVAAECKEPDGFLHRNAPDMPTKLWLEDDGFQKTSRGAGGDDGITHALNFHFGSGETGKFAPGSQMDYHSQLSDWWFDA